MSERPQRAAAIVVTGLGAVSTFGAGISALWRGLSAGEDGIRPVTSFDTADFSVHVAATVPEPLRGSLAGHDLDRCAAFAVLAGREALQHAALPVERADDRLGLVWGSGLGGPDWPMWSDAARIARALGAAGPCLTVSTACCSSTGALGLGRELLRLGVVDRVLAGGADVLTPPLFAGFHALGVMAQGKCAPFSEPIGMTLGEGAGFLLLEREDDARGRGAPILGQLRGYGLGADAYDPTSPDPSGAGVARTFTAALRDAALRSEDIGYVNLHGTGTASNDAAEWRAVQRTFGVGQEPAVSSSKAQLGHAQGAAGVLEVLVTLLAMREGVAPPTVRFRGARPGCPADPVASAVPRPLRYQHALCTNSAFGGANAAVVLSRADAAPAVEHTPVARALYVAGCGAVAGHGDELGAFDAALRAGAPLSRRVPAFELASLLRGADARAFDASGRFLTAAAVRALEAAGVRLRGAMRERAGLIAGSSRVSAESEAAFWESIHSAGLARLSANAFKRLLLSAPAGACSLALGLRGPLSTLTTGDGSGLAALVYAAELLHTRDDVDLLVAGAVDEWAPARPSASREPVDGAACVVLSALATRVDAPRLSGWSLAGPSRLAQAAAGALRHAGRASAEVGAVFGPQAALGLARELGAPLHDPCGVLGAGEASASLFAAVAAARWLRRGEGRVALVVSPGDTASSAVVLEAVEVRSRVAAEEQS